MTIRNILEMLYLDAYEAGLHKEDVQQTKFKLVELYLLKTKRNVLGE